MAMGLKNSPSTFQRLMQAVLRGLTWQSCLIYLDDIIIFSRDFESHCGHIEAVLQRLRQANLKLKPSKCFFAREQIAFLGHIVNKDGIQPDPQKLRAINEFPRPTNVRELRGFLGISNYYRRFIEGFSEKAAPLNMLLKKEAPFDWLDAQEQAFETLKNALSSPPVLGYPDFSKPFVLFTDACIKGLGAVLAQGATLPDASGPPGAQRNEEKVIAYAARSLLDNEKNYSVTQLELLAIIYAVKHFDSYVRHSKFTVVTDHVALKWLINYKNPQGRIARWIETLQQYDFDIIHRPGRVHNNADTLSRMDFERFEVQFNNLETSDLSRVKANHPRLGGAPFNTGPTISKDDTLKATSQDPKATVTAAPAPQLRRSKRRRTLKRPTDKPPPIPTVIPAPIQTETLPVQQTPEPIQTDAVLDPADTLVPAPESETVPVPNPISDPVTPDPIPNDPPQPLLFTGEALNPKVMEREQKNDSVLKDLYTYLENGAFPESKETQRIILAQAPQFTIIEGVMYRIYEQKNKVAPKATRHLLQVVVPKVLVLSVLEITHADAYSGHFGTGKTYEKLRLKYYWKNMYHDVYDFVSTCHKCSAKKNPPRKSKAPLVPIPVGEAWERISVDIVGPLPTSDKGNKYLLCFTEYLTKWSEAFAIPNTKSTVIAHILVNEIIFRHGAPKYLLSDRGSNFLSSIMQEVYNLFQIKKLNTSSYHPQTDGLCEKFNGTLVKTLSMYCDENQKDWDEHLPTALFAYNSTPMSNSTSYSPFYMMYGREPRNPSDANIIPPDLITTDTSDHLRALITRLEDAHQIAKKQLEVHQEHMKKYYDRNATDPPFKVGQQVYVHIPVTKPGLSPKLTAMWKGPLIITHKLSPVTFKLRWADTRKMVKAPVHANRMKSIYFRKTQHDQHLRTDDNLKVGIETEEINKKTQTQKSQNSQNLNLSNDDEKDKEKSENEEQEIDPDFQNTGMKTYDKNDQITDKDQTKQKGKTNKEKAKKKEKKAKFFEVQKVLKKRLTGDNETQYFIQWKGYHPKYNTWEAEANLNKATMEYVKENQIPWHMQK
jgi:hypothetical protein